MRVDIAATALAALEAPIGAVGVVRSVIGLDFDLAARADPAPVSDKGDAAEEGRLDRKQVEAGHVAFRIDTAQFGGVGVTMGHGGTVAKSILDVQRLC
jgi:hypothetical protein